MPGPEPGESGFCQFDARDGRNLRESPQFRSGFRLVIHGGAHFRGRGHGLRADLAILDPKRVGRRIGQRLRTAYEAKAVLRLGVCHQFRARCLKNCDQLLGGARGRLRSRHSWRHRWSVVIAALGGRPAEFSEASVLRKRIAHPAHRETAAAA
jgi:hypothetical protein